MYLPAIYVPFTHLNGFQDWMISSENPQIYRFYYRIRSKNGDIPLSIFIFNNVTYGGVDIYASSSARNNKKIQTIIKKFRDMITEVLYKRDRVKNGLQPII